MWFVISCHIYDYWRWLLNFMSKILLNCTIYLLLVIFFFFRNGYWILNKCVICLYFTSSFRKFNIKCLFFLTILKILNWLLVMFNALLPKLIVHAGQKLCNDDKSSADSWISWSHGMSLFAATLACDLLYGRSKEIFRKIYLDCYLICDMLHRCSSLSHMLLPYAVDSFLSYC